jgi:uncharacterized protein (DUF427 family)
MKAIWKNTVIAESPRETLIRIEGNWYFPPSAVKEEYLSDSSHRTTCFWKGEANYFDVTVDEQVNINGAWYYPDPKAGSIERVKHNFSHYIAFWNGIVVTE